MLSGKCQLRVRGCARRAPCLARSRCLGGEPGRAASPRDRWVTAGTRSFQLSHQLHPLHEVREGWSDCSGSSVGPQEPLGWTSPPSSSPLPLALLWDLLPWWLRRWSVCSQCGRPGFNPWVGKIPWRRKWQPTPVFCLENPRDRGAWRATVHVVTKSRTRLSDFTFFLSFLSPHLDAGCYKVCLTLVTDLQGNCNFGRSGGPLRFPAGASWVGPGNPCGPVSTPVAGGLHLGPPGPPFILQGWVLERLQAGPRPTGPCLSRPCWKSPEPGHIPHPLTFRRQTTDADLKGSFPLSLFGSCDQWLILGRPGLCRRSCFFSGCSEPRPVSRRGSRAELLWGSRDLPGPGIEPVSSALAGGLLTLDPQGSPILTWEANLRNSPRTGDSPLPSGHCHPNLPLNILLFISRGPERPQSFDVTFQSTHTQKAGRNSPQGSRY